MDFLEEDYEEILNIFRDESEEQIQKLNQSFLKLEANPWDIKVISELFREAHSLKGAARIIGFNDIQMLAHKLEDILGMARENRFQINSQTIDLFYKTTDCINSIIEKSIKTRGSYHCEDVDEIINKLEKITNSNTEPKKEHELSLDIDFIRDNFTLLNEKRNNNNIIDILISKLKDLTDISEDKNAKEIFSKILDIIVFAKDKDKTPSLEIISAIRQSFEAASLMFLYPASHKVKDPGLIIQRLDILRKVMDIPAIKDQKISKAEIIAGKEKTKLLPAGRLIFNESDEDKLTENDQIKTLRVDTKKLDQLVNQVGELIIAKIKAKKHLTEIENIICSVEDLNRKWIKSRYLIKHADKKNSGHDELKLGSHNHSANKNINVFFEESLSSLSGFMNQMNVLYKNIQEDDARLNIIINELEEKIKNIRLMPLATIFHMFPRMVRDLAKEKGKNIELIISGSDTSVDKKIIEEIKTPLIHIIRNSIDHGIESPENRIKTGKNSAGKIFLSAYHLENSILIEVIDDGKGINLDEIKKKAIEKGLLSRTELQAMNNEQIMHIIFWPGFSTEEVITDISGRGVGLDIVSTKIAQLNGKVSIKSNFGENCAVSIRLPITMATVKAFLVQANKQIFAIPTSAIKTTLLIKPEEIFYKEGRETIVVDDKAIPVCKLSEILEMEEQNIFKDRIVLIVIQSEDMEVGFIVDKLLGDQEIIHKNFTPPLFRVKNIAGVTTLDSGDLCLILNVNDLVRSACLHSSFNKQAPLKTKDNASQVKKNILIVDDSATTRILEKNILKTAGYNVVVAVNGSDALSQISSEKFDLIITDIEMPEINGFELTEHLRNDEKFKKIPVVLLSSFASDADKRKGFSLGADAYINKIDFSQNEFLSIINKLIKNQVD